jgi:hypothetical protein
MSKWVGLSAASKLGRSERQHPVIGRAEAWVLTGQHEARPDAAMKERIG